MQEKIDRLAIFKANLYGKNHHLHYFTQENSYNCDVCGAAIGIS
jgi:hypothetical protein